MSIKAMQWAREIVTGKGSRKQVLCALADTHHEDNDTCFASMAYLREYTELNHQTIAGALLWLQDAGLVTPRKADGKAHNYALHFDTTSSKIGVGRKAGNPANLKRTPSKFGVGENTEPPTNLEGVKSGAPPPNLEQDLLQISQQPPTNLEDKQDKRDLNGNTPCSPPPAEIANRVIEHLNTEAGKNFRLTENNRKPIIARLNDGFTELDCRRVVSNRVMRWRGTELAQYLRPDTLFRPSKFESYLNDAGETASANLGQVGYDPARTQALIDETFGAGDDPDPFALPSPGGSNASD